MYYYREAKTWMMMMIVIIIILIACNFIAITVCQVLTTYLVLTITTFYGRNIIIPILHMRNLGQHIQECSWSKSGILIWLKWFNIKTMSFFISIWEIIMGIIRKMWYQKDVSFKANYFNIYLWNLFHLLI